MTQDTEEHATRNRLQRIIERGTPLSGVAATSLASSLVGTAIGGPPGAVIGGLSGFIAAQALTRIGDEISKRILSPREEIRTGCVFALAAKEIIDRLNSGEQMQNSSSFDKDDTGRAEAEEAWEDILLKSQRESEEKTLPYMAHLLASTVFIPVASPPLVHQIVKTAEQLTYRQLCILRISENPENFAIPKGNFSSGAGTISGHLFPILYDYFDLYGRWYIRSDGGIVLSPGDVSPGVTELVGMGELMYQWMKLSEIPDDDIVPIVNILRRELPPSTGNIK